MGGNPGIEAVAHGPLNANSRFAEDSMKLKLLSICLLSSAFVCLFLSSGCGPSEADLDFTKKADQTMQTRNPQEIKAAAIAYFLSASNLNVDMHKNIPKEITSLPFFSDDTNSIVADRFSLDREGSTNALWFWEGSGFGHWGILICTNGEHLDKLKLIQGKVLPWKDGVFFWWSG